MNPYLTGEVIRTLREKNHMTQSELAGQLCVSDKAVSKWETGRGYPDISLLEPLAKVFRVSTAELLSGRAVENTNASANLLRCKFAVCPVCGNVFTSIGEGLVCCHGITLPPLEAEAPDGAHPLSVEIVEDEYFVSLSHPMTREHHISFIAAVGCDRIQLLKLYPEGAAQGRFSRSMVEQIVFCCNRDGLFSLPIRRKR